jgi:hypothetical protein
MLKPQDVLVVLQLCAYRLPRPPLAVVARDLGLSTSEVHGAIKRAQASRLLHGSELNDRPNVSAVIEFLTHGIRYVFPAERGEITRGIPTSYAAAPLSRLIVPGNDPVPVWPYPEGKSRGVAFKPLYPSVPKAALRDPLLYELLALTDALREGRVRERKIAETELTARLRENVAA